ncbi:MAG TPA: oxidoreductase, partial [Polyangiaceae bacterium]|nr:oxidoreductase [Polyangiaceae bacterium]
RGEAGALSALLTQVPVLPDDVAALGPAGGPAIVGEAIDAREANSWVQRLGDVVSAECLEALVVNAAAPFILSGRLRSLMARDALAAKWVVNVAAVEGQFSRRHKDDRHPHLNMAKAALNMLTRSSAEGFARDRIFMNSVDVGWFSNGEPARVADAMRGRGFSLPLDATDAAARVCDPVFSGVRTGVNDYGKLLKDYRPVDW